MARWPWFERRFDFDYPPERFPDLLERWRGTPARLEDRLRRVPGDVLTRRDAGGWSIQTNVGHLIDLGYLPLTRLENILRGDAELIAADLTNRKTNEAAHDARDISDLLSKFRRERLAAVAKFAAVPEAQWSAAGVHPRLKQPMRIVDLLHFDCEHDDYHLARIAELLRLYGADA